MNTKEASDFLGCSISYFEQLLEDGNIPFSEIGGEKHMKKEDVAKYKKLMKLEQKTNITCSVAYLCDHNFQSGT